MEQLNSNPESSPVPENDHQFLHPVSSEYLAGETVFHWANREQYRRTINVQKAEMLKVDAVLGELLYRMKCKLCRLGRNGTWSTWLRQQKIARSTADRLALDYAESHGLSDEFTHRQGEPLEGNICTAAQRTVDRLENMLRSPVSRMTFVKVLADLFQLKVDWEGEGARLSLRSQYDYYDENPCPYLMPNVIEMQPDGSPRPVNYELRGEEEDSVFYREVRRSTRPNTLREQSKETIQ
jgi:hypothetical protein